MDTGEALRRVRLILPMLQQDVRTAILSHAVMEASNDTIPKGMVGLHTESTDTYGAIHNALALKLALDLARIFDLPVVVGFRRKSRTKLPCLSWPLCWEEPTSRLHWRRRRAQSGILAMK
ncbi:hypothetical protein N181_31385 [Sinorhizobium fredii USDA 205]|nr:hypothetical protein N181_31385 [Sinorhizobium fredii USDA 205]GLS11637.1 hypothetical protein GCM10007864_52680 [Sinorhizobium fredii]